MEGAVRSKNFSSEDIEILLNLVKNHSYVLENKRRGRVRPEEKEKAWNDVADEFNELCPNEPRSAKVLRTKYCNLKSDMKKRTAKHKKHLYGIGRGPSKDPVIEEFDEILKQLMPEKEIQGKQSRYDSDIFENDSEHSGSLKMGSSFSSNKSEQHSFSKNKLIENSKNQEEEYDIIEKDNLLGFPPHRNSQKNIESPELQTDYNEGNEAVEKDFEPWKNYSGSRQKDSKNRKIRNEKVKLTNWSKLAAIKAKWSHKKMSQEVSFAITEHKLRVAHMTKMHKSQIELQELQKQFLKEKHELEMRILQKKDHK